MGGKGKTTFYIFAADGNTWGQKGGNVIRGEENENSLVLLERRKERDHVSRVSDRRGDYGTCLFLVQFPPVPVLLFFSRLPPSYTRKEIYEALDASTYRLPQLFPSQSICPSPVPSLNSP